MTYHRLDTRGTLDVHSEELLKNKGGIQIVVTPSIFDRE